MVMVEVVVLPEVSETAAKQIAPIARCNCRRCDNTRAVRTVLIPMHFFCM
jgi:hypothetical protein